MFDFFFFVKTNVQLLDYHNNKSTGCISTNPVNASEKAHCLIVLIDEAVKQYSMNNTVQGFSVIFS